MYLPHQSNNSNFIVDVIFYSVIGIVILAKLLERTHLLDGLFGKSIEDLPVLSAEDMLRASDLQSLAQSKIGGYDYNLMTNDSGRVMVMVQLGRDTAMHMVAIGKKSDSWTRLQQVDSKFLIPVKLEGDFPEYFKLYCSPEKEVELREILDPADMQRLVEFCEAYDLEIFRETLYLGQARGASDQNDPTTMTADLETFMHNNSRTFSML